MIAVAGEALIDLVVPADGSVSARVGGAGFNTARTVARLGQRAVFLNRLSGDGFGGMLRDSLDRDGVTLGIPEPATEPATLSVADVDAAGVASYRFYLTGTAAAAVDYPTLAAAFPAGATALHAGALALVIEPIGGAIERLIAEAMPDDVLVMIDPNCRPAAIGDAAAYRERLWRILRRADVVKVSTEDLGYLFPGGPEPSMAAKTLLAAGPAVVLITDGPRPVRAVMASGEITAEVPAVPVRDTIGAGDAFGGAFLAWWCGGGRRRHDLRQAGAQSGAQSGPVSAALRAAAEVAALTCTRAGAEPPRRAEVTGWPADSGGAGG